MLRNISLDILKIFLAVSVIALHAKIFFDVDQKLSFFTVNGIFRVGVPIFLIITGYYFLSVNNLKIWLKRIIFLYMTWMIIYSYFYMDFSLSFLAIAKNLFFIIFGYHHLWYLAGTILGGTLLFYAKNLSTKVQVSLALIFFLIGVTIQYLGNFHFLPHKIDSIVNIYTVYRNFLTVCFPFLMLGFLIHKLELNKKIKNYITPLMCISIALLYLEVYINYYFISMYEPLDLMFSLFLVCPLIFMYFLNKNITGKGKSLALFSTALYLIHPLFQSGLKNFSLNSVQSFLITIVLSILASIFLILIHRKFKFIL